MGLQSATQPNQARNVPGAQTGASATGNAPSGASRTQGSAPITHERIAQRAKEIWQSKGCPAGKDEENWREAEAQLKGSAAPASSAARRI